MEQNKGKGCDWWIGGAVFPRGWSLDEVRVSYAEIWGESIPGEEIVSVKSQRQGLPWRSSGEVSMLLLQGPWVWSLVRETSKVPTSWVAKIKNKTKQNKTLKTPHTDTEHYFKKINKLIKFQRHKGAWHVKQRFFTEEGPWIESGIPDSNGRRKIISLFSLTSNWNVAFPPLMNTDKWIAVVWAASVTLSL